MSFVNARQLGIRWISAKMIPLPLMLCCLLPVNTLSAQTLASPKVSNKVESLVDEIVAAEVELKVSKRRSKIIRMKKDVFRIAVADPSIIEVVAFGSREVELIGRETGTTSVTLWLGTELDAESLSMLVEVVKDDAVEDLRRMEFSELQDMINEMFPNSRVQLIPIADKLIVRGQARDEQEAVQIISLLRKSSGAGQGGATGTPYGTSGGMAANVNANTAESLPPHSLINMLRVPGAKQVMLKVRIAELKRSALRELGTDIERLEIGDWILNSVLSGAGGNLGAVGTFDGDAIELAIRFLTTNGSAKILAEPNMVVLSGETANFIAGGEFAVPTVVGVDGVGAASTSFKGFGTQVTFTPTVLDKDRIRLQVAPTFSTLNKDNSVNSIFGLDTRSVSTVVEMREGQVMAIAGLLQEQQRGDKSQIPGLGRIPILNAVAADRTMSRDETELLILVSPELIHPMDFEEAPPLLPGMEVTEPDDYDFFVHGAIEGDPNLHFRSTIWENELTRRKIGDKGCSTYIKSESYYLYGPSGFSE